jgi:hypothetical protein
MSELTTENVAALWREHNPASKAALAAHVVAANPGTPVTKAVALVNEWNQSTMAYLTAAERQAAVALELGAMHSDAAAGSLTRAAAMQRLIDVGLATKATASAKVLQWAQHHSITLPDPPGHRSVATPEAIAAIVADMPDDTSRTALAEVIASRIPALKKSYAVSLAGHAPFMRAYVDLVCPPA